LYRRFQTQERLFHESGGDFGTESRKRRCFVDDDGPAGGFHRVRDRGRVQRGQSADIEHLQVITVVNPGLGGRQGGGDLRTPRQQGRIFASTGLHRGKRVGDGFIEVDLTAGEVVF